MKFKSIFVEADEHIIEQILEIARNGLGHDVNAITINPTLKEFEEIINKKDFTCLEEKT